MDEIFGFKFDKEIAQKIRSCDTSLMILMEFYKNGIVITSNDEYLKSHLIAGEQVYWEKFYGPQNKIALVPIKT